MKHVEACVSAREYREGSFLHFGGLVRLIQASLCAANSDKTSEDVP